MIFISLGKFRKKPTKESVAQGGKLLEHTAKEGAKILGVYWTRGRYDVVLRIEGLDEEAAMKAAARFGDMLSTDTLVAIPREEAIKLLE